MRIDQFLNSVNIAKSRSIALDMLKNNVVFINNNTVKPSKEININDVIKIEYIAGAKSWKILDIPKTKTTPKSSQSEYIQEL